MKPRDRDEIADGLFDGLAPPDLPPELRARVLAAAGTETAVEPIADVWTRIWENRWLRMIWATSVVALIVGHVALIPRQSSSPVVTAEFRVDDGFAEFLRPIRIEESASPNLGRASDDARRLVEMDDGGKEL
jgi:hypothetical protein